jgi:hypothetical protein
MPSLVRRPAPPTWIAITSSIMTSAIASVATPATADAQQHSAQTSVAITVRVQPLLAIRGVAVAAARASESGQRADAVSVVDVESNLPYRLAVRLAPAAAAGGGRVFVRAASGGFEPVGPDASIVVAASRTPGRRTHDVRCRVEAMPAEARDADRCALVYELSAEHHDSLLRTTATVNDGLRTADTNRREATRGPRGLPSGP